MIFVTVGTHEQQFNRLIKYMTVNCNNERFNREFKKIVDLMFGRSVK